MMNDKTKVSSDYNYFGDQKKKPLSFYSTYAVSFLYILVIGLFVFNFLALAKIKLLETEVEVLKQTLSNVKLFDDNLIKEIIGFEDEEDLESNDSDQYSKVVLPTDWTPEYDDYETYDQSTQNDSKQLDYFEVLLEKLRKIDNNSDTPYSSTINSTNEEKELNRSKRNIVAATDDGVIINSESYAEKKSKNLTSRYPTGGGTVAQYPAQPSAIGSPWPVYTYPYGSTPSYKVNVNRRKTTKAPSVLSRRSRVKHYEDGSKSFRRIVKVPAWKSLGSYLDSYEDATTTSPDFTVVNFNKRRRILKPLPSAHYNGDTSNYVNGQHSNYFGNGHLRHPQSRFIDWKASDWVQSLGMEDHFNLNNGYLTIKNPGLYFIYSQVYYLDEHDTTGYKVMKNNQGILQCTLTVHSVERRLKGNTCFTAGVEYFAANDKLSIEDITEGMLSKFEVGKSFFGVIKLGDAKIQ
ncbi:protein eiger [Diorhabda carinulata]|uniref:protein eiger n=1 Tax=Diorhabda carinulata TaxID=1163345 RepID=UPI0025A2BE1B|nr:protein eiger [Diorhabda carinulata]